LPVRRLCIQLAVFADNCNSTSHNYNIICSLLMEYIIIVEVYIIRFNPQGVVKDTKLDSFSTIH
ncbi:hypothetical protein T07_11621, partial [Trichinella nelsoni]